MIEKKTYQFKNEFCKILGISNNQAERRLDDLLNWLSNFYDFEFVKTKPYLITIKEVYGEYQPMPRRNFKHTNTNQKLQDYIEFTKQALGPIMKPNSINKVSRDAIKSFGKQKYGHTSQEAVSRRFVSGPFKEYGETDNIYVWVWYSTYQPLGDIALDKWRIILREENIAEEQAANAFYRQAQGEDISEEIGYFKKALERFSDLYGDIPVRVKSWKLRD